MAIDNKSSDHATKSDLMSQTSSDIRNPSSYSASGIGGQSTSRVSTSSSSGTQQQETGMKQERSQAGLQQSVGSQVGNQAGNHTDSQASIDNIPDAVGQVVDSIFRSLQPKVHDAVTQFATRAVGGVTEMTPSQIVSNVRRNPWYTVGGVALLVVGLGVVLGLENRNRGLSPHELH